MCWHWTKFIVALLLTGVFAAKLGAETLPTSNFSVEDREQLGLSPEAEFFTLEEVERSPLVLILFDLYCPVCQKSAANLKLLGTRIAEHSPETAVLGVGTRDTPYEAALFARKFHLGFPVTNDREQHLAEQFETEKTPTVLLLERSDADTSFTVIWRREGYFGREHVDELLVALSSEED
jgi:peroxiredoxin